MDLLQSYSDAAYIRMSQLLLFAEEIDGQSTRPDRRMIATQHPKHYFSQQLGKVVDELHA